MEDNTTETVEVLEDVKPVKTAKVPDGWIVAEDGDNYMTIAERLGKGFTAESVYQANNAQPIYPGALVRIK